MFTFHSAPKNYHLAMHIFGLYTTASTLEELDDMVQSAAVVSLVLLVQPLWRSISKTYRLGFKGEK